ITAESGEIWCAWRSTSTPSTPGILMSVTITSKSALSILRLAASPEVTVSTLWPSRRRAISRSSQIERSSSQTRMLPTCGSSRCQGCCSYFGSRGCRSCELGFDRGRGGGSVSGGAVPTVIRMGIRPGIRPDVRILHAAQADYEARSLAELRTYPYFAFVGLHDLVDDGEAESGSAF